MKCFTSLFVAFATLFMVAGIVEASKVTKVTEIIKKEVPVPVKVKVPVKLYGYPVAPSYPVATPIAIEPIKYEAVCEEDTPQKCIPATLPVCGVAFSNPVFSVATPVVNVNTSRFAFGNRVVAVNSFGNRGFGNTVVVNRFGNRVVAVNSFGNRVFVNRGFGNVVVRRGLFGRRIVAVNNGFGNVVVRRGLFGNRVTIVR